jgi:hypothetical protein
MVLNLNSFWASGMFRMPFQVFCIRIALWLLMLMMAWESDEKGELPHLPDTRMEVESLMTNASGRKSRWC